MTPPTSLFCFHIPRGRTALCRALSIAISISLFQWCIMTIKILEAQAIHHSSSFHGHTLPILTYERIYRYLTPRCDDSAPKKDLSPRILRSLLAAKKRICSKKAQLNIFQVDEYSAFFSVSPWFLGKTIKHGKTILQYSSKAEIHFSMGPSQKNPGYHPHFRNSGSRTMSHTDGTSGTGLQRTCFLQITNG